MLPKVFTGFLLGVISLFSEAACREGLLRQVSDDLGYPLREDFQGNISACELLPDDKSKSVIAIASSRKVGEISGDNLRPVYDDYDLEVVVVETKTGRLLQQKFQKSKLESVINNLTAIEIEPISYQLAKGVKAFAIRSKHENNSDFGSEKKHILNLYVLHGRTLNNVLQDFPVFYARKLGNSCGLYDLEVNWSIQYAKTSRRGFVDLILQEEQIDFTKSSPEGSDACVDEKISHIQSYLVQYDGKSYSLPNHISTSH